VINNLGHAYIWQCDLLQAKEWSLRALMMAPGRSYARVDLGHAYAKQGNINKRVACFPMPIVLPAIKRQGAALSKGSRMMRANMRLLERG
jgi:hypothetical protein